MKILICIKQVVQYYVQDAFDPDAREMKKNGFVYRVNPYDETAIELALRIKEQQGESATVTLITMGPRRAEAALRWGLAMGADKAIHIIEKETTAKCPWITATVLSRVMKQQSWDIALFGKMAIDDEMGVTGTYVAELLNAPVVTHVCRLEPDIHGKRAVAHRMLEKGNQEIVTCPIPAVFTVDKAMMPRYPTFCLRQAARQAVIQTIETKEFREEIHELPVVRMEGMASPKLRPKKILSPDSSMSAAGRMQFVMKGGMENKKNEKLSGDPDQLASGIMDFLRERRFIAAGK